jgi:hypothetical protein
MGNEEFVASVRKLVQAAPFCGLTSDLWSEEYTKREYLGVSLHLWPPGAKKLTRLIIHNDSFDHESKTGINIREDLEKAAECFGLVWSKILSVSG